MKEKIATIRAAIRSKYGPCLNGVEGCNPLVVRWKGNATADMRMECERFLKSKCEEERLRANFEKAKGSLDSYTIEPDRSVAQVGCGKMP